MGSARSSSFSGRLGGSDAVRSIRLRSSSRRRCCSNRRSWSRGHAVAARVVLGEVGLRLGPQAQRAADPLHVDAEHAGALAAAERGDREPGEVPQRGVRAVPQRRRDLLAERVEVDLAVLAAVALAGASSVMPRRAASASAARKKKRSNTRSNTRRSSGDLASVAASASLKSACSVHGTCCERVERVEDLGGADRDALLAQVLGERQQLAVEAARALRRDRG